MTRRGRALRSLAACLKAGPDLAADTFCAMTDAEWPAILALANEHLVTATLRRALAPHRAAVPADVWRYLDYLHALNSRRNRFIRRQALQLVRAFNDAGIEPMLLKGALMTLFERRLDPGARMMADIDIAIPATARSAALAVMKRLGYDARHSFPLGHHAVGEYVRAGDAAAVDLHVEMIDQDYLLPVGEVWAAADCQRATGGGIYRVPSPTHRAMHNILHALIHYRGGFYLGELDLRQLFELAYLARRYERRIDWPSIDKRMHRHHLAIALQSYLRNAELVMGLRWPLARACSPRAEAHAWRCRAQLAHPILLKAAAPWGNLRAAFAWHRMAALHRAAGGTSVGWRYRHVRRLFDHHSARFMLEKLFRF